MLYVIGLGLGDAKDITVKGLEIIRRCDRVILEAYTSILTVGKTDLEQFYGCKLEVADREFVESNSDMILENADKKDVAFLVVGDPLGATTHSDLILRARSRNIAVQVIHNASILTAVGTCGLQLYSFGEVVSIPLWTDNWRPDSFYDKIAANRERGLHTLCLLDIKVKEPTLESIAKKKRQYMPPKFMSVAEAATQLLAIIQNKKTQDTKTIAYSEHSLAIGLARVGSNDQNIVACTLEQMKNFDLGPPLHCLVIPSVTLHPLESEYLLEYALNKCQFQELFCKE